MINQKLIDDLERIALMTRAEKKFELVGDRRTYYSWDPNLVVTFSPADLLEIVEVLKFYKENIQIF